MPSPWSREARPTCRPNLVVPSRLAATKAPAVIEIEYSNTGTDAMPAPLLLLTATQGSNQAAF